MNKSSSIIIGGLLIAIVSIVSCRKPKIEVLPSVIAYTLDIPNQFSNKTTTDPHYFPITEEGIQLGRMLFYDSILSKDTSVSCSSCHQQKYSFTDNQKFSKGVDNKIGHRNSMQIVNLLWHEPFFWDGRAENLEAQALEPVPNPVEMNLSWKEAIMRLKNHPDYPMLFYNAYRTFEFDSTHVANAISQFERTLISGNSKWDEFLRSEQDPFQFFTLEEYLGYNIFFTETGDCFHCHGQKELLTDNLFHNNGLDENFVDIGYESVTNNANDRGKFKTPSLRNVEFTAPYMHDGRFATLEEVVEHYSFGVKPSATIDPLMKKANEGGIQLSYEDRMNLIAFLKTFSDTSFITNKAFSSPFE